MILRLILLSLITLIYCQDIKSQKQDFVWFTGKSHSGEGSINFFKFKDSLVKKEFVVLEEPNKVRDGSGKATIADGEGNLLFYTDGFDVYNKNHQIMMNGDSVFAMDGLILDYYKHSGGVNIPDWTIILPAPAGEDEYYLFYLGIKDDEVYRSQVRGTGLNYSIIDMSLDGGLGGIVEKNTNLMEFRSTPKNLKAIRHANGRDWWIPVKEMENSRWRVFLLDKEGIRFSHIAMDTEIPGFYYQLAMYNYTLDQYVCMTGDHFYPWKSCRDQLCEYQFHIYDFDRCTGTFQYNRTFELETWSHKYALKSLTFGPNGRYLYGGLGGRYLIQYDSWADDVQATADTLLNIFTMDNAVPGIYEPKITPRGEMWLQHWASDSITVFQNPELGGSDFNISEDFILTGWLNQGTFPNNANYRIGPIDGSPCDTLGIDNLPRAWFRYNGANIGELERRFTDASYFRPENWHWDFDDGSTYDGQDPGVHQFPGVGRYRVCLTVSNENAEDTYCEWVEVQGTSNVRDQMEERGFVLYPNPGNGRFHLQFSNSLTEEGDLRVFNLLGKQLHREKINSGVHQLTLDLSHLPSGQYIIKVRFNGIGDSRSLIISR